MADSNAQVNAADTPGPVQAEAETATQNELVSGLWNMWNTATQKVSDAVRQAESNPTVQDALHKGKELAQKATSETQNVFVKVRDALDPMQGLRPPEIKVFLGSLQPSKVMAVQTATAAVFPVSDVSVLGAKVDSGVANQPVGFAAGQHGAENRIVRLKTSRADDITEADGSALLLAIENFIVEIESNWYDMACVVLRDEAQDISVVSFSQAVRVPATYVNAARDSTSSAYERKETGFETTVGEMIHRTFPHVSADDWHGHVTNGQLKRQQILEQCVVGVLGEYLVERRRARHAVNSEH